jgi:hypothetical protein
VKPTWLDLVQETAAAKQPKPASKRTKATPASAVQEVTIMVRRPSGSDPGEVVQAWYVVENGALQMVDQNGAPLGNSSPVTLDGKLDARSIAASLARKRWSESRGGFWRDL